MRILAGLAIVTALGATALGLTATAASAQPGHLSDMAYVEAARCAGLASSAKLGAGDAAAMKALLSAQASGRMPYILDQADDAQSKARHEADKADDFTKSKLQAELSGMCASLKG